MQMTDEVRAAIEVLKNAAENDFDRLTIERMESALTNPPRVEIVDDTHQKFNGKIYRCSKCDAHYERYEFLHVAVWEAVCGDIPAGCVVHHADFNPANNNAENLQLKTRSEHSRLHGKLPKKKSTFVCEWCGKTYESVNNGVNRFCSRKCMAACRRASGVDNEWRECVICHKKFFTRKVSKSQTCSCSCAGFLTQQRRRERGENYTLPPKPCARCGKMFNPKRENHIYCSKTCNVAACIERKKRNEINNGTEENSGKVSQADNQDKSITVG